MAANSYTRVNWVAMGEAKKVLDDQSNVAVEQTRAIQGLHEDAAVAWTGQSGERWRQAVEDWIDGFGRVTFNLNAIQTTLANEIQAHEQTEGDNLSVASSIVMPNV
jgi:uncharacterized protein YukE